MGLLRIDENKCKKDGFCVQECPFGIIRLGEDEGYPDIIPGGEIFCSSCGHCVAVCPHGALSHERVPIESSPIIKQELMVNEQQAVQFLRSRRSIRFYKDKRVEKEKIQKLIEVARYAPSAANMQPVEWLVISDRNLLKTLASMTIDWLRQRMKDEPNLAKYYPPFQAILTQWDSGIDSVLRNAPMLVVASAPKEAANGIVDVTLALCYMDLLAPSLGLGSCWAGLLQGAILSSPSLKEIAGIPARHSYHYPLMLGYPKVKHYTRLPDRKPPRISFK